MTCELIFWLCVFYGLLAMAKLVEGLMVEYEEGVQKGEDKRLDVVRTEYLVFYFRVVNHKSCYYRYYTSFCCLGC
jgi:hypothetical protein